MIFKSLFLTAVLALPALASNVLELSSKTFGDQIGQGVPALVEFYAPWCGHCKNLAPIYEQLADAFAHAKDKVRIVKIDADGDGKETGGKYGVTGFPTLKWFNGDDAAAPENYEGGRDLDALAAFITAKTGIKSKVKPPPEPVTLQLSSSTFDKIVMDEDKDVFVAFTAPWCGHCKALKPTLEKISATFAPESKCIIADLNADAEQNKPIGERYEVNSYPTIKFFPRGSSDKVAEVYEGGRSEEAIVEFLNEKCGTHRAVGGGLNDLAGRVASLDTLAAKFLSFQDQRSQILEEATGAAQVVGGQAAYYVRVMNKLVNDSEGWVKKETARLESILKKKSLAPLKLDEIKIKANILTAFLEKKAEEIVEDVKEAAEGVAGKVKDEVKILKEEL